MSNSLHRQRIPHGVPRIQRIAVALAMAAATVPVVLVASTAPAQAATSQKFDCTTGSGTFTAPANAAYYIRATVVGAAGGGSPGGDGAHVVGHFVLSAGDSIFAKVGCWDDGYHDGGSPGNKGGTGYSGHDGGGSSAVLHSKTEQVCEVIDPGPPVVKICNQVATMLPLLEAAGGGGDGGGACAVETSAGTGGAGGVLGTRGSKGGGSNGGAGGLGGAAAILGPDGGDSATGSCSGSGGGGGGGVHKGEGGRAGKNGAAGGGGGGGSSAATTAHGISPREVAIYDGWNPNQDGGFVQLDVVATSYLPNVTQQPSDVTAPAGTQVNFEAGAIGPSRVTAVHWLYSTDGGTTWAQVTHETHPGAGGHEIYDSVGDGVRTIATIHLTTRASDNGTLFRGVFAQAFSPDLATAFGRAADSMTNPAMLTVAPGTTLASGPSGATHDTSPSFAFTSDDAAATFECRTDGPATTQGTWSVCTSPHDLNDLADGDYTFSVRAKYVDGGADPSPETRTFTVDTTAPTTTIDSGPSGLTKDASPSFGFSSSESGSSFSCRLDGPGSADGAWASCVSSKSFSGLADGAYKFSVQATDAAGNTGATAARSFTIDTLAPGTTIDSGPSGATKDTTPTFAFSSNESDSSFSCRLDGPGSADGAWASCTSPKSFSGLTDGAYTFSVQTKDAAGNTDGSAATRSFAVDTTAPSTTIDSGPSGLTKDASPSFGFSSSESGSSFSCRLDGPGTADGAWAPCASSKSFSGLADGAYRFSVQATDAAGNTDASAATRSFRVDTLAPDTTINSGPSGATNDTSPTFEFTSSESDSWFTCRLDGPGSADGEWVSCTSPESFSGLTDGAYTFSARAKDDAGNAEESPATRSFTIDTTAPNTTIDTGPTNPSNQVKPALTFSADEQATFECKLDAGSFGPCTSGAVFGPLDNGSHTLAVRATDPAGNTDPTPATRTWIVDAMAPNTTIDTGPTNPSNQVEPAFTFSADEQGTFECKLDEGSFNPCTSGATLGPLGEGSHTFAVRATDAAGNTDPTPATRTWIVDTTPPQTTITSSPPWLGLATKATFEFTSSEGRSTFQCSLEGGAWKACTSPHTYTGIQLGAHTFAVRAIDQAGNTDPTPSERTWHTLSLLPF